MDGTCKYKCNKASIGLIKKKFELKNASEYERVSLVNSFIVPRSHIQQVSQDLERLWEQKTKVNRHLTRKEKDIEDKQKQDSLKSTRLPSFDTVQMRDKATEQANAPSTYINNVVRMGVSTSAVIPSGFNSIPISINAPSTSKSDLLEYAADGLPMAPTTLDPEAWVAYKESVEQQQKVMGELEEEEEEAYVRDSTNALPRELLAFINSQDEQPRGGKKKTKPSQSKKQTKASGASDADLESDSAAPMRFLDPADDDPTTTPPRSSSPIDHSGLDLPTTSYMFLVGLVAPITAEREFDALKVSHFTRIFCRVDLTI